MNPLVVGSSPALPTNTRGRAPPYDVPGSQSGREPDGTQTDSNCDTTESDAVQPTARGGCGCVPTEAKSKPKNAALSRQFRPYTKEEAWHMRKATAKSQPP